MDDHLQNGDDERGAGVELEDEEVGVAEAPPWDMISLFLLMFGICSFIFILVVICFFYKRRLGTMWRASTNTFNLHWHPGTTEQRYNPQSFELSPLANRGYSEPGSLNDARLNVTSSAPAPGRTQRTSHMDSRNEGNVEANENEPGQTLENPPEQFPHARSVGLGGLQKSQPREMTARSEMDSSQSEQPERKCSLPSGALSKSSNTSRQPSVQERAPRSVSADSRRQTRRHHPVAYLMERALFPPRPQPDLFGSNPNRKKKAVRSPDDTLPRLLVTLLTAMENDGSNPEASQPGPSSRW